MVDVVGELSASFGSVSRLVLTPLPCLVYCVASASSLARHHQGERVGGLGGSFVGTFVVEQWGILPQALDFVAVEKETRAVTLGLGKTSQIKLSLAHQITRYFRSELARFACR